jgi:predicted  nucleic acid-binding Zn-ribbon protein
MSSVCLGKIRTCKGKHYCYLSRVTENLDSIVTRLRETAAVEADAKRWQAYQAEQEAARKAEEERQTAIAKAKEKIAKLDEKCSEYESKWHATISARTEAERELEALLGEDASEEAAA